MEDQSVRSSVTRGTVRSSATRGTVRSMESVRSTATQSVRSAASASTRGRGGSGSGRGTGGSGRGGASTRSPSPYSSQRGGRPGGRLASQQSMMSTVSSVSAQSRKSDAESAFLERDQRRFEDEMDRRMARMEAKMEARIEMEAERRAKEKVASQQKAARGKSRVVPIGGGGGGGEDAAPQSQKSVSTLAPAKKESWCTLRNFFCNVVLPLSSLGLLIGALYRQGYRPSDVPNMMNNLQDMWGDWVSGEDNLDNAKSDSGDAEFQEWTKPPNTEGEGLVLEIVNALDPDWHAQLAESVEDWQSGSPRALKLRVRSAPAPDPTCSHIDGVMKACNGDYGDRGWNGLNEVLFDIRGRIVSSVAMMNEHYLRGASDDERRYVMCHELGHGFGLPHRDEDAHNADLGSCLDYTVRPWNNVVPDETDYRHLADMYGIIPGSGSEPVPYDEESERRLWAVREAKTLDAPELGEGERKLLDATRSAFGERRLYARKGRLLHRSSHGEAYEVTLDDGRRMVTRVLY